MTTRLLFTYTTAEPVPKKDWELVVRLLRQQMPILESVRVEEIRDVPCFHHAPCQQCAEAAIQRGELR